jgi:hypothetical protein
MMISDITTQSRGRNDTWDKNVRPSHGAPAEVVILMAVAEEVLQISLERKSECDTAIKE